MCGIIGFSWKDSNLLREMALSIEKRGPDGDGFFEGKDFSFAHRRLSILDLSDAGSQPMFTDDKRYVITFNGEIYNYQEIREELEREGYLFNSNSDTEVLLKGYSSWGKSLLDKLNGMFVFAIWDTKKKELFLARDRIGIKPLYYHYDNKENNLIFSSEMKAFFVDNLDQDIVDVKKISREAVNSYFSFFTIAGNNSILGEVKRLGPGEYLIYSKKGLIKEKYWEIPTNSDYLTLNDLKDENLLKEIDCRIEKAVKYRMISDVPVGVFLSGGVDSSLIAAKMVKLSKDSKGGKVKSFSIGFEEDSHNELMYAREVADYLGTDHYEKKVTQEDALSILPILILEFGEPFGDHSALPMYFVSKLAKEHVTVVLSGDGADELFGGYKRYLQQNQVEFVSKLPELSKNAIISFLKLGAKMAPKEYKITIDKLSRGIELSKKGKISRYAGWFTIFDDKMKKNLFKTKLFEGLDNLDCQDYFHFDKKGMEKLPFLQQVMVSDIIRYIPDDILTKVDRTSMIHSIEARVPFLDHTLVEFAQKIPVGNKIKGNMTKYLLKKIAENYVPKNVLYRKKQGFGIPTQSWFKGKLGYAAEGLLLNENSGSGEFLNKSYIKELFADHRNDVRNYGSHLWTLLCFEIWCLIYLDGKNPEWIKNQLLNNE